MPVAAISTDACVSRTELVKRYGTSCQSVPLKRSGTEAICAPCEPSDAEGQLRRAGLGLDPDRAVVLVAGVDEDAALADAGAAALGAEAHALLPVLELHLRHFDPAAVGERRPVCREVLAFEPGALDLLGEESVFDRVVDVLQEVAVDPPVDRCDDPVGIDEQDGDARSALARSSLRGFEAAFDAGLA